MNKRWLAIMIAGIFVLFIAGVTLAASNSFSIPWWTVDSGGGTSQGGDYSVTGTIGQPDTSPLMSGGDYTVVGGFWGGALPPPSSNLVYMPLVFR